MALLETPPKTAIEAYHANENKIGALVAQCGAIAVDMALVRLLDEVFKLTLSPVTADQLAAMAGKIRSSFPYLGFEEITYALNKGIDGGYGAHFGHINYQHIGNWMAEFDKESGKAIADYQESKQAEYKSEFKAVEWLSSLPEETLSTIRLIAERDKTNTHKPNIPDKEIRDRIEDGRKLVQFDNWKRNMKMNRVVEWCDDAYAKGMVRTLESVNDEIHFRVTLMIQNLCERVMEGEELTEEDRKLLKRSPDEIKFHFKNVSEMIIGFEEETAELNDKEKELLPVFVKCLQKYVGKQNPISNRKICIGFRKQNIEIPESRVRKIINHIRVNGLVKKLCANSKGYYIASTDEELREYIDGLRARANSIRTVLQSMEQQL